MPVDFFPFFLSIFFFLPFSYYFFLLQYSETLGVRIFKNNSGYCLVRIVLVGKCLSLLLLWPETIQYLDCMKTKGSQWDLRALCFPLLNNYLHYLFVKGQCLPLICKSVSTYLLHVFTHERNSSMRTTLDSNLISICDIQQK